MNLIWPSTFTDALGRLAPQEQKQAKLTATGLRFDAAVPGDWHGAGRRSVWMRPLLS